ncbi:unnamed protein product [Gordionus sp. m RMFG-2023]
MNPHETKMKLLIDKISPKHKSYQAHRPYITSTDNNYILCLDGHCYIKFETLNKKIIYKCVKDLCLGAGIIENNSFKCIKPHSNFCMKATVANKFNILSIQGINESSPTHETYNKICSQITKNNFSMPTLVITPNQINNELINEELSSNTTFHNHSSSSISPSEQEPLGSLEPMLLDLNKYEKQLKTYEDYGKRNILSNENMIMYDEFIGAATADTTTNPIIEVTVKKGKFVIFSQGYFYSQTKVEGTQTHYNCRNSACPGKGLLIDNSFQCVQSHVDDCLIMLKKEFEGSSSDEHAGNNSTNINESSADKGNNAVESNIDLVCKEEFVDENYDNTGGITESHPVVNRKVHQHKMPTDDLPKWRPTRLMSNESLLQSPPFKRTPNILQNTLPQVKLVKLNLNPASNTSHPTYVFGKHTYARRDFKDGAIYYECQNVKICQGKGILVGDYFTPTTGHTNECSHISDISSRYCKPIETPPEVYTDTRPFRIADYRVQKWSNGKIYYICRTQHCRGRGKLTDGNTFTVTQPHAPFCNRTMKSPSCNSNEIDSWNQVVHEDYTYRRYSQKKGIDYYKCLQGFCKGRGVLIGPTQFNVTQVHDQLCTVGHVTGQFPKEIDKSNVASPLTYVMSNKGLPMAFYEGCFYLKDKDSNGKTYYRCRSHGCNGRGKSDSGLFVVTKPHGQTCVKTSNSDLQSYNEEVINSTLLKTYRFSDKTPTLAFYNGRFYMRKNKSTKGTVYYHCRNNACQARAKLKGPAFRITKVHDESCPIVLDFGQDSGLSLDAKDGYFPDFRSEMEETALVEGAGIEKSPSSIDGQDEILTQLQSIISDPTRSHVSDQMTDKNAEMPVNDNNMNNLMTLVGNIRTNKSLTSPIFVIDQNTMKLLTSNKTNTTDSANPNVHPPNLPPAIHAPILDSYQLPLPVKAINETQIFDPDDNIDETHHPNPIMCGTPTYLSGKRAKSVPYFDGYLYKRYNKTCPVIYCSCRHPTCPGQGFMDENNLFKLTKLHNHNRLDPEEATQFLSEQLSKRQHNLTNKLNPLFTSDTCVTEPQPKLW